MGKKRDGKRKSGDGSRSRAATRVEASAVESPRAKERPRPLDAWLKLLRAAESLKSSLATRLAPHKLTLGQFAVLEATLHCGPLCQRDLAQKLQVSGGNVTTIVDNLERRGLVRRERSTRDRRYIAVHLSERGRHLIKEVFPEQAAAIRRDMSVLRGKRLDRLARYCKELGVSLTGE